jgi:hypothetical protein
MVIQPTIRISTIKCEEPRQTTTMNARDHESRNNEKEKNKEPLLEQERLLEWKGRE